MLYEQIEKIEKSISHKTRKGINFAILANNVLEYVNIPSNQYQKFSYDAARVEKPKN